jgi:hypothetical protein
MENEIRKICEEVAAEICDKYCKYPTMPIPEGKTEDWLMEDGGPCENCPLNRIN